MASAVLREDIQVEDFPAPKFTNIVSASYTGLIIDCRGKNASIDSGLGNDTIYNDGNKATINGGAGDDYISNDGDKVIFFYKSGNDTISGFNATSTLKIDNNIDFYSTQTSGNDVIVNVGTDSITLIDAAGLDTVNINFAAGGDNTLIELTDNKGGKGSGN